MNFTARLNKRDQPYVIADEPFALSGGVGERFLNHDNVNEKTIELYTEPGRQGEKVLNYTIEKKNDAEWKLWLKVFAQADRVYVSYESLGDTVEADDLNELQQAAVTLEAELEAERRAVAAHRENRGNPHAVTRAQVGLGSVDNTADVDKPVSTAQGEAIEALRQDAAGQLQLHAERIDNPHTVTKEQIGLGSADNTADRTKPLSVPQAEALENVRGELSADIAAVSGSLTAHEQEAAAHVSAAERQSWGDKYTRNEVDNKLAALELAPMGAAGGDLTGSYPNPSVRDNSHAHTVDNVTGLQTALNGKAAATHSHAWDAVAGKPSAFPPSGHGGSHRTGGADALTAADIGALPAEGGTITGNLVLKGSGNYGNKINFGDGDYVHLYEISDDKLEIKATNLDLSVSGTATYKGRELSTAGHTHGYLPTGGITWNQLKGV